MASITDFDSCTLLQNEFGISFDELRSWNPSINTLCNNLVLGDQYCVDGSGTPATETTILAPATTPSGTVDPCYLWHVLNSSDTCVTIEAEFNINFHLFRAWNPSIGYLCDHLVVGDAYCLDGLGRSTAASSLSTAFSTSTISTVSKSSTTISATSTTNTSITSTSKSSTSITTAFSSLPTCGQTCFNNMLAQYSNLGCSTPDPSCLCSNVNFGYGIRDCSNGTCGTSVASAIIAYGSAYCTSALATATGIITTQPSTTTTTALSSLPSCGQLRFNNMLDQYSELGCASANAACLCANVNFGYGIGDCSNGACGTAVASAVIAYGSAYCAAATAVTK